jgi:hypothetical protein
MKEKCDYHHVLLLAMELKPSFSALPYGKHLHFTEDGKRPLLILADVTATTFDVCFSLPLLVN